MPDQTSQLTIQVDENGEVPFLTPSEELLQKMTEEKREKHRQHDEQTLEVQADIALRKSLKPVFPPVKEMTEEQKAAMAKRREDERKRSEEYSREQDRQSRKKALEEMGKVFGRQYDIPWENLKEYGTSAERDRQRAAKAKVKTIVDSIGSHVSTGRNLLFFGPVGSGKDQYLWFCMKAAIQFGFDVRWINGSSLYLGLRSSMQKNSPISEDRFIERLIEPKVLAISDPLPPSGAITAFQAQALFTIFDERYRTGKPLWVTANVASRTELDQRLGSALADRLIHASERIHCDWSSYREFDKNGTKVLG